MLCPCLCCRCGATELSKEKLGMAECGRDKLGRMSAAWEKTEDAMVTGLVRAAVQAYTCCEHV